MMISFNKINLRKKFLLLSSIIVVAFALILSGLFYRYMKKIVVQDALEKSELILQEVEAIRAYVIEELRPKMYDIIGNEDFVLEAMSTTYVSLRIMQLFQKRMEDYSYRRVSQNPLNPENSTNEWEDEMFDWFETDKSRSIWQGQVKGDTSSYYISVIPDYMDKECLRCHGDSGDAPTTLIDRYGTTGGFRFSEGDLAGLNSVSIPISQPLSKLATLTGMMFLLTLCGSLLLLLVVNLLFDKLVVSRLSKVVESLTENKSIYDQNTLTYQDPRVDELDSLQNSFRHLNRYVKTARRGDNLQPNFIGPYVINKPIATGTMSWLYSGEHSETGENVLLKIPFNNLYINPLYVACLQAELQLIQHCSQQYLPKIKARIEDILILNNLTDVQIMAVDAATQHDDMVAIVLRIFEVVAYLHTNDIVHHDLRPENFLITNGVSPIMIDMGLAHWRKLPDPIFESGMGPQGDLRYMAPEQLKGMRGDPRSDLYSLGVMLFFITTGMFPHQGEPGSTQAWLSAKGKIPQGVALQKKLPPGVINFFEKALAYEHTTRYQWVEDMRDDFIAYASTDSRSPEEP